MIYKKEPKNLGLIICDVREYFSYTYLPIKLVGQSALTIERRLKCVEAIAGRSACDFIGDFGLDRFVASNVYITAKHQYQRGGQGFNRPGWHSDGFGTDDISYIWSNRQPTVFNDAEFDLSRDDVKSMEEMDAQAHRGWDYTFADNSLLRLDQFSIHKVGDRQEGNRAFVKICFSPDQYRLKGNSINYDLDYQWEYQERQKERNIPQS